MQHNNVTEKNKQSAFADGMKNETIFQWLQFLLLIRRESAWTVPYPAYTNTESYRVGDYGELWANAYEKATEIRIRASNFFIVNIHSILIYFFSILSLFVKIPIKILWNTGSKHGHTIGFSARPWKYFHKF